MTKTVDAMDQILAASAFRQFCLRGIARVTMDDIAADAGVTKGSLYWHYRSKAEVIAAACDHYYESWRAQMSNETAGEDSAASKLAKAIRSSVRTCLIDEGNRTFTLELFTLSIHDPEVRGSWRRFFNDVKEFYNARLAAAMREGHAALADAEEAVDLMLSAMEGYKLRALFEPELCSRDAEVRITRELLGIVGLTTPEERTIKAAARKARR